MAAIEKTLFSTAKFGHPMSDLVGDLVPQAQFATSASHRLAKARHDCMSKENLI